MDAAIDELEADAELERNLAVLRSSASQQDYDRARAAIAALSKGERYE
jgi:hypothetical protein